MKIEILYFEDCPNHPLAERRIREVLDEAGIVAPILRVPVPDDAAANALRFPGSPTIRVNGEDVVPAAPGESYGLRCRVYPTAGGLAGVPAKDAIRAAILGGEP